MILWDDFDRRATKVMCDHCQRKVEVNFERMAKSTKFHNNWPFTLKPIKFKLFGRTVYISIFREHTGNRSYLLKSFNVKG